jgi:YcxB-like protein
MSDQVNSNPYAAPNGNAPRPVLEEPRNAALGELIRAKGDLNFGDLMLANRLHRGRLAGLGEVTWVVPAVLLAICVLGVIALQDRFTPFFWAIVFGVWLLYATVIRPRALRAEWRDLEPQAYDIECAFTSDGVHRKHSKEERFTSWSSFVGFRDSNLLILLYETPVRFSIVPRRWFAFEEDFNRLILFLGHRLEMLQSRAAIQQPIDRQLP